MVLTPKRVALTGPDGSLGQHMVALLNQRGIEVVRLGRAQWDLCDWIEPDSLDQIVGAVDALFHFGALTPKHGRPSAPAELIDANVRACAALGLWAIRSGVPLIYAASAGIYAYSSESADEDAPKANCPLGGFYGLSKLLGERLLQGLTNEGLRLCSLRIASLYGTGMAEDKLVGKWMQTAIRGGAITLQPPVDDAVNLVHGSDVARAALAALRVEAWGCFNIGGPAMVSMADLAGTCVNVVGRGAVHGGADHSMRPPEARFNISSAKASAAFGYVPEMQLRDGLTLMKNKSYVY